MKLSGLLLTAACFLAISITTVNSAESIPSEYVDLYSELENNISTFETLIERDWDRTLSNVAFSAQLGSANAHLGPALISPDHYIGTLLQLDSFKALGVTAVTVNIAYPVLYQPFHESEEEYLQYLDFYIKLAQDIRSRGMTLIVETGAIWSKGSFSKWPAGRVEQFYNLTDDPGFDIHSYQKGRKLVAQTIAERIKPDYLSVLTEPDTEATQTGIAVIDTRQGAIELLEAILDGLWDSRANGVSIGAGVGSWQTDYLSFLEGFIELPLDYMDVHTFATNKEFLSRLVEASDLAKSHGKRMAISQAWLYKIRDAELEMEEIYTRELIISRDVFGFWEQLDAYFVKTLAEFAHYSDLQFLSPFWSGYFSSYVKYNDSTLTLPPSQLLQLANNNQSKSILNGSITTTGLRYAESIIGHEDLSAPVAPADLSVTIVDASSLYLTWSASEDNIGVAGYSVFRNGKQIATTTQAFYLDKSLPGITSFTYVVSAFDAQRNESPVSLPVTASTPDLTPPQTPEAFSATAVSDSTIELWWLPSEDNGSIYGYKIHIGLSPDTLRPAAFTTETKFSQSGLPPKQDLYFAVQAVDSSLNQSTITKPILVTTLADLKPPAIPENLVSGVTGQRIDLSWSPSSDNVYTYGYKVYLGLTPETLNVAAFTRDTKYGRDGLPAGLSLYFAVEAVDVSGNISGRSDSVKFTIQAH